MYVLACVCVCVCVHVCVVCVCQELELNSQMKYFTDQKCYFSYISNYLTLKSHILMFHAQMQPLATPNKLNLYCQ